jgi:hypothetical protein
LRPALRASYLFAMLARKPRSKLDATRRPMARAERLPLFEREVRERLSTTALDLIVAHAEVLAEGRPGKGPTSRRSFFGSVMITVDLERLGAHLREAPSPSTAERLARELEADARARGVLRRLGAKAAGEVAGAAITVHPSDVRIRAEGCRVLVDIDVESVA